MNKRTAVLVYLLALYSPLMAQKDTASLGLFITNLYDFNLAEGCYSAEFWTWTLYKNTELDFKETQEVKFSKKTEFSNASIDDRAPYKWLSKKCTTTILQDWDVRKFPFDQQALSIFLEDADADTTELVYLPDIKNSKFSDALNIDGWKLDSFKTLGTSFRYNTSYGDPLLDGESVYPSVGMNIFLSRTHSWITFFKLVTGVFVAFLISILVFYIRPAETDTRISLAVGGLFAAVGNKYIVESVVPTTTQVTIIDYIHMVAFGEILFIILMIIVIANRYYREDERNARRLENLSFWFSLITFFGFTGFLLTTI